MIKLSVPVLPKGQIRCCLCTADASIDLLKGHEMTSSLQSQRLHISRPVIALHSETQHTLYPAQAQKHASGARTQLSCACSTRKGPCKLLLTHQCQEAGAY